jgi:hypothetical protein
VTIFLKFARRFEITALCSSRRKNRALKEKRSRSVAMKLRAIIFLITAFSFAACSRGPATVGELKDFDAVCDQSNKGKRVAVEGYLRFPNSFKGERSAVLRLYKTPDFRFAPVGVQMEIGNGANQFELPPKQYKDSDLKVHLANGQVVGTGTKVRVSGSIYYPLVGQDFECALENPLVEIAK